MQKMLLVLWRSKSIGQRWQVFKDESEVMIHIDQFNMAGTEVEEYARFWITTTAQIVHFGGTE